MSLYSAMYSGVSGLSAQSASLGIISQNIANVNTIGYKGNRTEFSSLVTGHWNGGIAASAGGVRASSGSLFRQLGLLQPTQLSTDLALCVYVFFTVSTSVYGRGSTGDHPLIVTVLCWAIRC